MSLIKKIKDYYKKRLDERNILFTTPSHEQGKFIAKNAKKLLGEQFFKCDFSEIEGFDNLRNPAGVIKSTLDKFTKIYNSKQTFLLTNGSTSGVIAMMTATLKQGDKVLVARNCHISVFNALVITGAVPVWFMPDYDKEWGIYKGITKDNIIKHLSKHTDIKAVVITSPTYQGLFSDIAGISQVCKKQGIKLLVDEAHGALLNFGDFKTKPAVLCGADMSVQSLHKTAGAPNPCALLHISKDSNILPQKVQDCLNIINTTSPSYPLMLACEICVDFLNSKRGRTYIQKLISDIEAFKKTIPPKVTIYEDFNDPTKLLLNIKNSNAIDIADILNNKYHIEEEFSTEKSMLLICGIGTSKKKLKELFCALEEISESVSEHKPAQTNYEYKIPKMVYTPREAMSKEFVFVDTKEAVGKISAKTLIDYPPGIPFVVAGEIIDTNSINFIQTKQIKICK